MSMTTMFPCAFLSAAAWAAVNANSRARSVAVVPGSSPDRVLRPPAANGRDTSPSEDLTNRPQPADLRQVRYSRRLAMYCTTPSGTKYQTGLSATTRARHSLDEIAIAGTSTRVTESAGR